MNLSYKFWFSLHGTFAMMITFFRLMRTESLELDRKKLFCSIQLKWQKFH